MPRNRNREECGRAVQPSVSPRFQNPAQNPTLLDPDIRAKAQEYARSVGVSTADAIAAVRQRDRPVDKDASGVLRIFGTTEEAVTLGAHTYHLALYNTRGVMAFQDFVQSSSIPAVDGATPGEQFIAAALMFQSFEPIRAMFGWMLSEAGPNRDQLPPTICFDAHPIQLRDTIDRFFAVNGLVWLTKLVKTYGGQTQVEIDTQLTEAIKGVMDHARMNPPTIGTDTLSHA